ncbi:1-deoxy-D-xylulose-5-phosphate reductoisomerase [Sneathiella chungangensis]|uniref:1-deoxy-D-xylulose 5-phosphate reductoisomerase n=1 Tax=Sneathiella chungangensis TaxID=1418234 RepID=A0A845MCC5_9PROT|nr:1-deoxy-D-xylulose-5-phosphate reductoisomerase [Sneathiella chungangensis]MZR20986.1 1-deoxy-D-xylulose-5-phosphate reductoisomerase [Sneathiella chungangensis]
MSLSPAATEISINPRPDVRRVSIFGSTGSIGVNTLDLIAGAPDRFQVEVLTANENAALLAEQALKFGANLAVIGNEAKYRELKSLLSGSGIEVAAGETALSEAASRNVDWVMLGIVGAAGLAPTLAAARAGAIIAIANKEALVCGGDLVLAEVKKYGATLLPVDSEHNAIFQVLDFDQIENVSRLVLTASGGPFLDFSIDEMKTVTRDQALAHPNWDMGAKISIDSATMMNKGLEFIEAVRLFPVPAEQIDILVHPQSVIHSMVEYSDGSVLAQMGAPDMRTPISYTLGWPERHGFAAERLDLAKIGSLTFQAPDLVKFPAIRLAREALSTGKSAPTVLNASNEVAVHGFLEDRIGFLDIAAVVEESLARAPITELTSIEDIFECDRQSREQAQIIMASYQARL